MSARREARARVGLLERAPNGVPVSLQIGRCVEVWSDPRAESAWGSSMRRFSQARDNWATKVGIEAAEMRSLVPNGTAWSIEFLTDRDHAGQALVAERLERAGCDLDDIDALAIEASRLCAQTSGNASRARSFPKGATA